MKEKFENKESSPYQELYDLIEIKIGASDSLESLREALKEGHVISFVVTPDFDIYLSDTISHDEICQQNDLEPMINRGYLYKDSQGEERFSIIEFPSYDFPSHIFRKYLPALGENAIKNIIKDKIKFLLAGQ